MPGADRNLKGVLCSALIAVLVIGLAAAAARVGVAEPTALLYVDPPSYITTSLGEFTVDVNILNVSNLQGFEFKLGYNATILGVTNVTFGSFLTSIPNVKFTFHWERYPTLGYIRVYANITDGGPANGNGTLAIVTLNATYSGAASCALDLFETALTDPQGGPISHGVADGYYEFVVLSLTVMTGKPPPPPKYAQWYYGELYWKLHYADYYVHMLGNLTASEREGGLVALEVVGPEGGSGVRRTLQTGPNPPAGDVVITALFPCNSTGDPVSPPVFWAGSAEPAYFSVTIENRGTATEPVRVILDVCDSSARPLGSAGFTGTIDSQRSMTYRSDVLLPSWASNGNGTVYASVFTADPRSGGVPHCPQVTTWFNITGGTAELPSEQAPTGITADYNMSFRLPHNARTGNYTVYVSSTYRGAHDEETTTFTVRVLGDASGDGHVDIFDLTILGLTWYKVPGDPGWDERADFNLDGRVDVFDLVILGLNWYKY